MGKATYIKEDFWPLNTSLFITDFRGNDPRFVYYLLKQVDFSGYNSGAAHPMLNRNYIKRMPLRVPRPREQRAISSTLGALDDKITVNERGASTALELAIAEYGRMGIEQAWPSMALGETAHWYSGGTPKTSEPAYWDGDIPWISAKSLQSPWIDRSDRNITELGARNGTRLVPNDTVIFVVRGSSLDSEFRVGLTQCEVAFGQDCKALRTIDTVDSAILLIALKANEAEVLKLVDHTGHGAGRLSTELISKFPVRLPTADQLTAAKAVLRPLAETAAKKRAEIRTLATLRDTLLPKLMSGELRVWDAEKAVEEAT